MRNEKDVILLNPKISFLHLNNRSRNASLYMSLYSLLKLRYISYISFPDAHKYSIHELMIRPKKSRIYLRELVYFGLFDRILFDEYGILTSEELQRAIPCEIDERYRLIDKPPQKRKSKNKSKEQPQQSEALMSVEALKDELNDASVERIAKSVGTTDQSFIRATLEEFIAYQREVGNADNRTMTDMKKHFINFCKKKLKHNGASSQNTRHSGNGATLQSDDKDSEFYRNISRNSKPAQAVKPQEDLPF